jgi:hypothetical protein
VASAVVLNDGHADARQIVLIGSTSPFRSAPVQFAAPGVYSYRLYTSSDRQGVVTGVITVTGRDRATDQRGMALPQRGVQGRYFCDIGAYEFQTWTVGEPLPRPPSRGGHAGQRSGPSAGSKVDTEDPPYHAWSAATAEDLPLRPSPQRRRCGPGAG